MPTSQRPAATQLGRDSRGLTGAKLELKPLLFIQSKTEHTSFRGSQCFHHASLLSNPLYFIITPYFNRVILFCL